MCCKHNVLISLFCAMLLSDVYIAGSPLIKQPLSSGGGRGREAGRCAPFVPFRKSGEAGRPPSQARRPLGPPGRDRQAEASGLREAAGPERPAEAERREGKESSRREAVSLPRDEDRAQAVRGARARRQPPRLPPRPPRARPPSLRPGASRGPRWAGGRDSDGHQETLWGLCPLLDFRLLGPWRLPE